MTTDSLIGRLEALLDATDNLAYAECLVLVRQHIAAMENPASLSAPSFYSDVGTAQIASMNQHAAPVDAQGGGDCSEISDTERMRSLILGSSLNAWAIDGLRASRSSYIDDWEKQHNKVVDATVAMLESIQHEFYKRGFNEAKAMYSTKPVMVDLEAGARTILLINYGCDREQASFLKRNNDGRWVVAYDSAKACAEVWGLKYE